MVDKGKRMLDIEPTKGEGKRLSRKADRAYQEIRKMLIEFRIKPEERIGEIHICKILALSRTPIREALNRLATEGFLVFRPNYGFSFRSLEITDLIALYDIRSILETGAFALLCARASDEELARLKSYWAESSACHAHGSNEEILDLDEGFHLLMAGLSGNPEIVRQLEAVNARIRFIRRIQIEHALCDPCDSHGGIVDAACRRNVAEGVALLKAHIAMSVTDAQKALKEAFLKLYLTEKPPSLRWQSTSGRS